MAFQLPDSSISRNSASIADSPAATPSPLLLPLQIQQRALLVDLISRRVTAPPAISGSRSASIEYFSVQGHRLPSYLTRPTLGGNTPLTPPTRGRFRPTVAKKVVRKIFFFFIKLRYFYISYIYVRHVYFLIPKGN